MPGQERLEVAQVVAQMLWGNRRILPAAIGGLVQRHPRQARPVRPQFPQRRGLRLILDDPSRIRGGLSQQGFGAGVDLGRILTGQFDEHPALAVRQPPDGTGSAFADHDIDDAAVKSLTGRGLESQQAGNVVTGAVHRRIAERHHQAMRRIGGQTHRGAGDDPEGALGTCEELRHVEASLGQQMLHGVAGDLA